VPGTIEDATNMLANDVETARNFNRVTELVDGFETPFGMELLASVHWVVTREGGQSIQNAITKMHQWNERKKMFTDRQIEIAYDTLQTKGWLNTA
jgi:hypothetical protein